ncbi:MAG: HAD family phosphatase [Lachnospiraceae bacterium]|nr:HAD family phosphatase [Lachnospiraceae bacterium]
MIKNVVFDIGGVLADYKIKEFLANKGFDGTMIKRILKASIMSPYWGQFERAELTEEETLKAFASLDPEIEDELYKAYSNVEGMLVIRDFAIPIVKKLKEEGLNVYFLSNYSKKAYDECGDSLAFMEYMDGGILSFMVGKTKPDPEMYKLFLNEYDLKPEECVFVDDTEENVVAAGQLDFNGIVFKTYEDMIKSLKEFKIEIREEDY